MNEGNNSPVLDMNGFMNRVKEDPRIKPSHISLYVALTLHCGDGNEIDFNTFRRGQLLLAAKVSLTTFHRCMHDLHDFGYLRYMPSYDPKKKSKLLLYDEE